ncbi:lipid A-modifier LpxR family protein [Loktanella sp. S4079]|uniref:lipid A-modifier LpxR family protein n=1 Tax=Loktanella sp. S4079 TaxID=579483 RepID=UPI000AEC2302|nr:lipid A-modifier LpxR family protein [Loktanella sp. S4079]
MLDRTIALCKAASKSLMVAISILSTSAFAEEHIAYRGEVGSFVNDFVGDGHDRWHTGSYQKSYYSQGYQLRWLQGLELRSRSQIVSPWVSSKQRGGDRPYSTAIGVGGFAHGRISGFETRLGGEILLLGDGTGLEALQRSIHDGLGMEDSFDPSRDDIDRVETTVTSRFDLEIARSLRTNEFALVRPYAEITFGGDRYNTFGTDVILGPHASASIWTRDVVTGRLLTPQANDIRGLSIVAGIDVRSAISSIHLPDNGLVNIEPKQFRSRFGIQSSSPFANIFIGQARLSEGFVGQKESQRVGLLSVSFSF